MRNNHVTGAINQFQSECRILMGHNIKPNKM